MGELEPDSAPLWSSLLQIGYTRTCTHTHTHTYDPCKGLSKLWVMEAKCLREKL